LLNEFGGATCVALFDYGDDGRMLLDGAAARQRAKLRHLQTADFRCKPIQRRRQFAVARAGKKACVKAVIRRDGAHDIIRRERLLLVVVRPA
jgi:hypothetical protein